MFRQSVLVFSLMAWQGVSGAGVWAEEPATPAKASGSQESSGPGSSEDSGAARSKGRVKQAKKRKGFRGEKEAEGTEAADRFEANTVIKSKYKLNGETLEVDPD